MAKKSKEWLALAVAVVAIMILAWHWPAIRTLAGTDEAKTVRDWIAAFGSGFAIVGVLLLWKQVRDAERQNRRAIGLQFRSTFKLAETACRKMPLLAHHCDERIKHWQGAQLPNLDDTRRMAVADSALLIMAISSAEFARIQEEIDVPDDPLEKVREALEWTQRQFQKMASPDQFREDMVNAHQVVKRLCNQIEAIAKAYRSDFETLMDG